MRGILAAVVVLFVVIGGYAGSTLWRAQGGLPQWDGAVEVNGIDRAIDVLRDENGVPHVFAETERDAYFAQGFVHAQDRFWQMALARQAMSGRLAEWLGSAALRGDRYLRTLGYSARVEDYWNAYPVEAKTLISHQERQALDG